MKLATNVYHASENCRKSFQGQRSKVKGQGHEQTEYCNGGGMHFDGVVSRLIVSKSCRRYTINGACSLLVLSDALPICVVHQLSMGTGMHGQGGHLPPWKCCKVVFVQQMLSKASVDGVFMFHFKKLSSAYGGFASRPPPGNCPWTPLGDFRSSDSPLPTPGKNPAGAHAYF